MVEKLQEIKKGELGRGILIEHDGYLTLNEETKKLCEGVEGPEEWYVPDPFIVDAVFQKYGIENANGRIYPENILKREVEKYQIKINEKRAYGECNHPSETVIDLGRICMNIMELHWEGHTLVGKLEIETSYGFRKYGFISCLGDMIANHLLHGYKIGVSSRGVGSVEQKFGSIIVGDDFELICWDVVSDPSTPNAWITNNQEELQTYIENKENSKPVIEENEILKNLEEIIRFWD